jgi:hypothetical protein
MFKRIEIEEAGYPLRSTGYNIWFISDATNFPEVERDCPYD